METHLDQPAAFRCCYSDWKLIRTRKVVQIVLEVPIEESDLAYQVLGGMPNPAAETWCAVARLRPSDVVEAPSTPAPALEPLPARNPNSGEQPARATNRLTIQAAILCDDELFQTWLRQVWGAREVTDKHTAAAAMRKLLCIESRKEIVDGSEAADRYNKMVASFEA